MLLLAVDKRFKQVELAGARIGQQAIRPLLSMN
jgi:hypothetical protein